MLQPPGSSSGRPRPSARRGQKVETPDDVIRQLQKLPPNKRCADCGSKLPSCVNLTVGSFVCITCAGIHRELSQRVKGVGHSKFTQEEVDRLKTTDNEKVNLVWLARYNPQRERMKPPVGNTDQNKLKSWIRRKYSDKAWYAAANEPGRPPQQQQPTMVQMPPKQRQAQPAQQAAPVDLFADFSAPAPVPADGGAGWDAFGGQSPGGPPPSQQGFANFDQAPPAPAADDSFPADFGSSHLKQQSSHFPPPQQQQQGGFANFNQQAPQQAQQHQQQMPTQGGFANFGQQQMPGNQQQAQQPQQQMPPQGGFANFGQQQMPGNQQQAQQPQQQMPGNQQQAQQPQQQMPPQGGFANFGQHQMPGNQQMPAQPQAQQAPPQQQMPNQTSGFANFNQQPMPTHQQAFPQQQMYFNQQQMPTQQGGFGNNVNGQQQAPLAQQPNQAQQNSSAPTNQSLNSGLPALNPPGQHVPETVTSELMTPADAISAISVDVPAPATVPEPTAPPKSAADAISAINLGAMNLQPSGPSKASSKQDKLVLKPGESTYQKGQRVIYKSASYVGEAKVVKVHFDDDLEPFYTIEVNGKEKQTDDGHLDARTPLHDQIEALIHGLTESDLLKIKELAEKLSSTSKTVPTSESEPTSTPLTSNPSMSSPNPSGGPSSGFPPSRILSMPSPQPSRMQSSGLPSPGGTNTAMQPPAPAQMPSQPQVASLGGVQQTQQFGQAPATSAAMNQQGQQPGQMQTASFGLQQQNQLQPSNTQQGMQQAQPLQNVQMHTQTQAPAAAAGSGFMGIPSPGGLGGPTGVSSDMRAGMPPAPLVQGQQTQVQVPPNHAPPPQQQLGGFNAPNMQMPGQAQPGLAPTQNPQQQMQIPQSPKGNPFDFY